jgi:MFS transporter, CP family, cyanate transporter
VRRRADGTATAWPLVVALVLAALNLRTAVTSVGPLLAELQRGVGLSPVQSGVLTTLPVVAFAALGWVTPPLARRLGAEQVLALALATMSAGLLLRARAHSGSEFLALTVPTLAAGAMGNVLLPALVKRDFPRRIGAMTAAYTTALAVGTTTAAATAAPLASLGPGRDWRLGLGAWAVPAAVAALLWLPLRGAHPKTGEPSALAVGRLLRSRTAWAMTLYFGSQAMLAYIAFGWFAQFFREQAGASAARAGLLVAVLAGLSIPVSLVVPAVAARLTSQRPLIAGCVACYAVAYTGMVLAPSAGAVVWVVLAGLGGSAFPLALTLINLRSRTTDATAALSAFSQSVGYLLAGTGPLLVGVLRGLTGGWDAAFVLLFADLLLMSVAGWCVGRPRFVDDDLQALTSRGASWS